MKGKLTRISTSGDVVGTNPLRTTATEGVFMDLPQVGKRFSMFCDPIIDGAVGRLVSTSGIVSVVVDISDVLYTLKTLNSTYKLEILND